MRRLAALAAVALAGCLASQSAFAEKRIAFVVGNSNYQNVVALTNPANDAVAITEMFRKAAFDVVESRRDLKNAEMRRALRDFTEKARDADIAVIYYAGHGIEVDGTNYLVPVDAALERDTDAYDEAISLDRILQAIEPAKQLRLVILDACRDNPFAKNMKRTVSSRSLGRGLAGVEPARPNTLIAFAAKGGSTASDGDTRNSPFTTALLKYLARPGLELGKAFRLVRDDVMNATGNKQEPFVYGSLGGNDVALVPAPASPPVASANVDIRRDYELAERVGTKEAWDSFVAANPSGFYSDLARAQRNKLAAETARIAATERARGAAEEQARLTAEKKKQIEEARAAAAQAKAAEDERLAAEKVRREAEKAKKPEEAKVASAEQAVPKEDRPNADKPADPAVAALTPPGQAAPEAPKADQPALQDIARLLQSELKRVGCKTGEIDGEWNAAARRALSSFNDRAGTRFDVKLASLDALDAVRARTGRVCPLDCDRGFRAEGDRCVKITCDSDQVLGPNGTCRPRPERAPRVEAHRERSSPAASSGRGKCFAFNGKQVCE
ncbi:caspase family protein [Bradyrhizobium sp.]|uniref:caspase family protein n=1 Tax=Bradyrhizobium sp. TaxID=376 RepID=UPI003D13DE16